MCVGQRGAGSLKVHHRSISLLTNNRPLGIVCHSPSCFLFLAKCLLNLRYDKLFAVNALHLVSLSYIQAIFKLNSHLNN